jgi:hypothetical protein
MLAEEDKKLVEEGRSVAYDVSPSAFLSLGMDIQGQQYVPHNLHVSVSLITDIIISRESMRREVKGLGKQTVLRTTSLIERRTTLVKRIQRFRDIQHLYMPGLDPQLLGHLLRSASHNPLSPVHVEDSILFMPSDLPDDLRRQHCAPGLASVEDRLRYAEAYQSLDHLRHHLRNRTFTNKFKVKNVTGQKNNTRSRESQHRIDDKVKASQLQYCRARQAVLVLRGPGDWEIALPVLNPADVRALNERQLTEQEKVEERRVREKGGTNTGMTDEDNEEDLADIRVVSKPAEVGEGTRRPSWIWFQTSGRDDMSDPLMKAGK